MGQVETSIHILMIINVDICLNNAIWVGFEGLLRHPSRTWILGFSSYIADAIDILLAEFHAIYSSGGFRWLDRWAFKMLFAIPISFIMLTFSRSWHLDTISMLLRFMTLRISSTLTESYPLLTSCPKKLSVLTF